jgi:hypothetical protein
MKKLFLLVLLGILPFGINAQGFVGAWETYFSSDKDVKYRSVVIFSDNYQVITTYEAESGKFISTNGGTWKLEGDTMTEMVEFDTVTPERVGTEISFKVHINDSEMGIVGDDRIFERIDSGKPGELQGAWLMSGRVRDGKEQLRDVTGPRKTMKLLSGTRFQWIAYHTESKRFIGAGGGTYTTIDGKYTENIEFFSKDDSKAGISLVFDYNFIDGVWHHEGFSSKGDAMHEIWSVRE